LRGKYNPIPASYSRSLVELVDKLLTKDYRQRPDIEQILRLDCITEKMRLYGYVLSPIQSLKIVVGQSDAA